MVYHFIMRSKISHRFQLQWSKSCKYSLSNAIFNGWMSLGSKSLMYIKMASIIYKRYIHLKNIFKELAMPFTILVILEASPGDLMLNIGCHGCSVFFLINIILKNKDSWYLQVDSSFLLKICEISLANRDIWLDLKLVK